MPLSPQTELDLRGLRCPMPALRTRKALRTLEAGATLQVIADDPLAAVDIPHLVRQHGHELSGQSAGDGFVAFLIVKRPR